MGTACVPRAADGVAPPASFSPISPPFGGGHLWLKSLRRDAANHTPEAYAPHSPLHRSGKEAAGKTGSAGGLFRTFPGSPPHEPPVCSRRREEAENAANHEIPPPYFGGYGSGVQSANLSGNSPPETGPASYPAEAFRPRSGRLARARSLWSPRLFPVSRRAQFMNCPVNFL